MILACNHISKTFSGQSILKDAVFHINEQERVALVGVNGAGKTTLLRIIIGELEADSGDITKAKNIVIGYLPQQQGYHSDKTIYEELLSVKAEVIELDRQIRQLELRMQHAEGEELSRLLEKYNRLQTTFENGEGYTYKSKVMGVINGLGFGDEKMKPVNHLSGGQKTRVALGKLLLTEPDLLMLDEPTNHLDLSSIQWLENYLTGYRGSVLVVSHDRYFLDRIAHKVVEIDRGHVTVFPGNYSEYSVKKETLRQTLLHQYYSQQQEIRHQEAVIAKLKSFNREKSIRRAESREKMLDKIERMEKPVEQSEKMNMELTPLITSGNDVLSVEDFEKSFGEKHLFDHVNFQVKRGEKIALIGENGTGKTTLLKMICQLEPVDAGTAKLGTNVEIGYYDQEHSVLHDDKTIFEEIQDDYPDLTHTQIRNVLAAFLFTGEDVFKPIHLLSGGEKGRVSLAKLMLSQANFLLLDEPTNHLDITSKEILESAINNYSGTLLYVSHDRYFINRTATRILDLKEHKLLSYPGNYQYYLEKKETVEGLRLGAPSSAGKSSSSGPGKDITEAKQDWHAQKQQAAERRKLENEYRRTEREIEELETEISSLDEQLALPENAANPEKLMDLTSAREEKQKLLDDAMERWEELAEQSESI